MPKTCDHEYVNIYTHRMISSSQVEIVFECEGCGRHAWETFDLEDLLYSSGEWPAEGGNLKWKQTRKEV